MREKWPMQVTRGGQEEPCFAFLCMKPTLKQERGGEWRDQNVNVPLTKINTKQVTDLNLKHKTRRSHRRKPRSPWVRQWLLDTVPKAWSMEEIIISWTSLKFKTALQKAMWREWKGTPQTGRKNLQKIHLIKGCFQSIQKTQHSAIINNLI